MGWIGLPVADGPVRGVAEVGTVGAVVRRVVSAFDQISDSADAAEWERRERISGTLALVAPNER